MEFEVDVPEPSYVELELDPVPLLHGPFDPHIVRERVYLGHPTVWQLTPDQLPEDLKPYGEQNSHLRTFGLMLLDLNFRHMAGEPILMASLEVTVSTGPHAHTRPGVVLRMSPLTLSTPQIRSSKIAFKADFGMLKPEAEHSRQGEVGEAYLLTDGVGTPSVQWSFRRVAPQELDHPHQLTLIVDTPKGVRCDAVLSLSATIRKKRVGFLHFKARIPHFLAVTELTR
ncbi:hypothetical protein [Streptomyces olivochromogenes]|uniref:hypothetical protein n=1 Tax=Streptomyces olivochromogenes TaxID=1963 RepID=UPI001F47C551|nr:hypothetical protein [Streptomyces olivochromogenes]MCF3135574.1 hypothetical protein [Streptomyces olivochromogenes]